MADLRAKTEGDEFKSGVAFYGFPYSNGSANQSSPADMSASGKYFELKVYQGQPHGFMIEEGELSESFPAKRCLQRDGDIL